MRYPIASGYRKMLGKSQVRQKRVPIKFDRSEPIQGLDRLPATNAPRSGTDAPALSPQIPATNPPKTPNPPKTLKSPSPPKTLKSPSPPKTLRSPSPPKPSPKGNETRRQSAPAFLRSSRNPENCFEDYFNEDLMQTPAADGRLYPPPLSPEQSTDPQTAFTPDYTGVVVQATSPEVALEHDALNHDSDSHCHFTYDYARHLIQRSPVEDDLELYATSTDPSSDYHVFNGPFNQTTTKSPQESNDFSTDHSGDSHIHLLYDNNGDLVETPSSELLPEHDVLLASPSSDYQSPYTHDPKVSSPDRRPVLDAVSTEQPGVQVSKSNEILSIAVHSPRPTYNVLSSYPGDHIPQNYYAVATIPAETGTVVEAIPSTESITTPSTTEEKTLEDLEARQPTKQPCAIS